jgi:hypothetical protein
MNRMQLGGSAGRDHEWVKLGLLRIDDRLFLQESRALLGFSFVVQAPVLGHHVFFRKTECRHLGLKGIMVSLE